ncbi:MAG: putative bifunctional diguanylate cyclase/phosphodiesterase [Gammaproteobacteria bacterium]
MKDKYDATAMSKIMEAIRRAADGNYCLLLETNAEDDTNLDRLTQEINNMLQQLDIRSSRGHRVEKQLELTQFAIDHASIGCSWNSSENKITYVNDQICESLGYTRDELLTMGIQDIDPDFPMDVWDSFWQELKQVKVMVLETRHRRKDGTIYPVEVTTNFVEHEGKEYSCAFSRDITERKKSEEQIRRLAYYDSLTNLPNRRFYKELLVRSLKYAGRYNKILAVLFIDLDGFKRINDTLGHETGDRLLQEVAIRLEHCIRNSDYLARQANEDGLNTVSRIGGDEFIVLLNDVAHERDASRVSQRILEKVSEPFLLDTHKIHISASIGISHFPGDGDDAEVLLNNADIAMYQAKHKGKNNYQFYSSALSTDAMQRLLLEGELHKATKNEDFFLHYQPRVDINNNKITGMEALLRWEHPQHGLVSPAEFIPIAEETGLILPMGEWVLRQACTQIAEWQSQGVCQAPVAVNISRRQFEHHDLYDVISGILEETACDPASLELEITESLVMNDVNSTIETLSKLRSRGIKIAMDDFGTGYSSLAILQEFPLDFLKIDRSFVKDITTSSGNQAIAAAIIAMSHSLNLKVIAEGVEREDQLEILREFGCDEIQGFLFSRPMPSNDCEAYLKDKC